MKIQKTHHFELSLQVAQNKIQLLLLLLHRISKPHVFDFKKHLQFYSYYMSLYIIYYISHTRDPITSQTGVIAISIFMECLFDIRLKLKQNSFSFWIVNPKYVIINLKLSGIFLSQQNILLILKNESKMLTLSIYPRASSTL